MVKAALRHAAYIRTLVVSLVRIAVSGVAGWFHAIREALAEVYRARLGNKLHAAWHAFMNLPRSIRIAVWIASVVGGPPFLGGVTVFATYSYAWFRGFRVPVEGSPYLSLAVSLASAACTLALFLAVLAAIGCVFLSQKYLHQSRRRLKLIARRLAKRFGFSPASRARQLMKDVASTLVAFPVALAASLTGILASQQLFEYVEPALTEFISVSARSSLGPWASELRALLALLLNASLGITTFFVLWRFADVSRGLATIAFLYITFLLTFLAALFCPQAYGWFLRTTHFGGGIQVTIVTKENTQHEGALMLVTNTTYVLRGPVTTYNVSAVASANEIPRGPNKMLEIPSASVSQVVYALDERSL